MSATIDVDHSTGISSDCEENLSQTEQTDDSRVIQTSERRMGRTAHDGEQQTAMVSPSKAILMDSLCSASSEDSGMVGAMVHVIDCM